MFDLQPGPLSLDTADTDRSTMFREVLASAAVINEAFSEDSSLVDFGSLVYRTDAPRPPGFKKPSLVCSGTVKGKALGGAHGVGEVMVR